MSIKRSVLSVLFIGLGATVLSAQVVKSLDAAINEVAGLFARRISYNTTVAVTSFGSSSSTLSNYIISEMTGRIFNAGAFYMVTREHLDEARKELNFNTTAEIDEKTAQRIGRFVGAQTVIFGSIAQQGKNCYMKVQAVQVETGRIMGMYTATVTQKSVKAITGKLKPYKPPRQPSRFWEDRKDFAYRNYMIPGVGPYAQFGDHGTIGGGDILFGIYASPFPFISTGFDLKAGGLYRDGGRNGVFGGAFSLGFVFPFDHFAKLFATGTLEVGYFGGLKGLISEPVAPAFDAGLSFFFYDSYYYNSLNYTPKGFEVKYRGTFLENQILHSIGIAWTIFGGKKWRAWD